MLLRALDAFGKDNRYIEEFSAITNVGPKAGAAAIRSAFSSSKDSRPRRGDLSVTEASVSVR